MERVYLKMEKVPGLVKEIGDAAKGAKWLGAKRPAPWPGKQEQKYSIFQT